MVRVLTGTGVVRQPGPVYESMLFSSSEPLNSAEYENDYRKVRLCSHVPSDPSSSLFKKSAFSIDERGLLRVSRL